MKRPLGTLAKATLCKRLRAAGSANDALRADNERLRADNERMRAEHLRLENGRLRSMIAAERSITASMQRHVERLMKRKDARFAMRCGG